MFGNLYQMLVLLTYSHSIEIRFYYSSVACEDLSTRSQFLLITQNPLTEWF